MIALFTILFGGIVFAFTPKKVQASENGFVSPYDGLFQKYGALNGIDWKILRRIAYVESRIGQAKSVAIGLKNPNDIANSVSFDGKSWGLMQVTLETGAEFDSTVSPIKLNNAEYSIMLGAKVLKDKRDYLSRFFIPTEQEYIMAYNHGEGNSKRFHDKQKAGTLMVTEFSAGKDYWNKYLKAKEIVG